MSVWDIDMGFSMDIQHHDHLQHDFLLSQAVYNYFIHNLLEIWVITNNSSKKKKTTIKQATSLVHCLVTEKTVGKQKKRKEKGSWDSKQKALLNLA